MAVGGIRNMSQHYDMRDFDQPVRVLARISFLSAEAGGRAEPIVQRRYSPQHNFQSSKYHFFYIGEVEVPDGATINPGETHDLTINFMGGPGLLESLTVGKHWRLQEADRLVAYAELLSILNEP